MSISLIRIIKAHTKRRDVHAFMHQNLYSRNEVMILQWFYFTYSLFLNKERFFNDFTKHIIIYPSIITPLVINYKNNYFSIS